jgi:hypothetical protein
MTTFGQTQKLARVQPPLVPGNDKKEYYCENRNCKKMFGISCSTSNLECRECGTKMILSIEGLGNDRCRQDDDQAPSYAKCIVTDEYYGTADHTCKDCMSTFKLHNYH